MKINWFDMFWEQLLILMFAMQDALNSFSRRNRIQVDRDQLKVIQATKATHLILGLSPATPTEQVDKVIGFYEELTGLKVIPDFGSGLRFVNIANEESENES